ncbi:uncharacterized protein LOC116338048 [Contarinia nasturtii]|uniref:uncharacterized protein LOC116338048 n=1 Tax=Contarinia nasturtii TaxID=265458 RepID=UPI0012D3B4F5|nr:uncharacterized protein LOC116338048 [Contarinia nasturtii]
MSGVMPMFILRISMLFVWMVSTALSMTLLWQSLSDHWEDIEIWDSKWILPAVAYPAMNVISHFALIYYTINNGDEERVREIATIRNQKHYIACIIFVIEMIHNFFKHPADLFDFFPFMLLQILLTILGTCERCQNLYPCTSKCFGKEPYKWLADTNSCPHSFPFGFLWFLFVHCYMGFCWMKLYTFWYYFPYSCMGYFPVYLFYDVSNIEDIDLDECRGRFREYPAEDSTRNEWKYFLEICGLYNEYLIIIFFIHISSLCHSYFLCPQIHLKRSEQIKKKEEFNLCLEIKELDNICVEAANSPKN